MSNELEQVKIDIPAPIYNTVVIDTETLDITETAIVLTLSAYRFDRFAGLIPALDDKRSDDAVLHLQLNVTEQLLKGRTTSASTISWWNKQSDDAKASVIDVVPEAVNDTLNQLDAFIGEAQPFFRGTDFDPKILGHLYSQFDRRAPWKFNQVRDVRTYIDAFTNDSLGYIRGWNEPDWFVAHNSLHDCIRDAMQMIQARKPANAAA